MSKRTLERDARRRLAEHELQVDRQRAGLAPITSDVMRRPLRWLVASWWDHRGKSLQAPSIRAFVEKHLAPMLDVPLAQVTAVRISKLLQTDLAGELAPKSLKHLRGYLFNMFEVARRQGGPWHGRAKPIDDVDPIRVPKVPRAILQPHEMGPVVAEVPERWRGPVATALYAGLREGEIFGLRKEDVDLRAGVLMVSRSWDANRTKDGKLRHPRAEGRLARWVEARRRERRGDPVALAELVDLLLAPGQYDLAEQVLALSLDRHPGHPLLRLCGAELAAARDRWNEVEPWMEGIAPTELPSPRGCHVHHLRGLARVYAGDPGGAHEQFAAGAALGPRQCDVEWNLDLVRALLDPLGTDPELGASGLRRVVRACRLADAALERGDPAVARDALEIPAVHFTLEVQSAARLAEAHLRLEPATPRAVFRKALALARFASIDSPKRFVRSEIPGLGWDAGRLAAVRERAEAWLEEFERRELGPPPSPSGADGLPREATSETGAPARAAPADAPKVQLAHALPPLGHEAIRALVPGLDDAVREAARYARAQPGWDETQTLRDDLPDFRPVRAFLRGYLDDQLERGIDPDDALSETELVGQHLDYCVNFELHRRKVFFADASLAWMLDRTNLDIEARALRLPFPCFAVVFTDRATLAAAEALVREDRGILAGQRLEILTVYVKRTPAPDGRSGLSLSMVFEARAGEWPYLLGRELCMAEDDDLETILDSRFPDPDPDRREAFRRPEMRKLVHVVVNAILYATSADVAWPLTPSPVRALESEGRTRGKAKRTRLAHRAEELSRRHSSEDVFYLPGRIPISQLRALEDVEQQTTGRELLARFMVRGHWRRANPAWQDQRVRWIEPYWKGPELAAIVEKGYRLKL